MLTTSFVGVVRFVIVFNFDLPTRFSSGLPTRCSTCVVRPWRVSTTSRLPRCNFFHNSTTSLPRYNFFHADDFPNGASASAKSEKRSPTLLGWLMCATFGAEISARFLVAPVKRAVRSR